MKLKFFSRLEFFPFVLGLTLGIFFVYILKPAPLIITKYPNLENTADVIYRDRNGTCFQYEVKELECDKVEDRIRPYPIQ